MTKKDGVTLITMSTDLQSAWPPLCQIFKALCYSPVCCSVSENMRRVQGSSQVALGVLQILIGLLNIGLAIILLTNGDASSWEMDSTKYPVWFGALFVFFGIMCILLEKFPSPCLGLVTVSMNMAGVAFSIAAIVLYSINLADISMWWLCRDGDYYYYGTTTPSADNRRQERYLERCREGKQIILGLVRGINGILIVLSALQLCIAISSVVLGCKAVWRHGERSEKNGDVEHYTPLLEQDSVQPVV